MNVGYADINSSDAATILGVKVQSITYWCRHGYMKYVDVSGPRSTTPRYMFTEDEVDRIQKLMDKYGKKWMFHLKKETEEVAEPVVTEPVKVIEAKPSKNKKTERKKLFRLF